MRYLKFYFVVSIFLFCVGVKAQNLSVNDKETLQKLGTTLYIIDNFYVDSSDLKKVTEDAILGMLRELDPHSAYIPKEEVEKANEQLVGSFEGIGVTFQLLRDTILVVSPVSGGPSEKVGIMAGDKIVKIDGESSVGKKIDNEFVTKRLRGKKGSKVILTIKRGNDDELLDFEVIRDKIPLNSIDAAFMLNKNVGYIRLDRFAKSSADEFRASLEKLKKQNMKSLVFDLRGNSGGYLNIAVELCNEFIDKNKMVVYTEGLKSPKVVETTKGNGNFMNGGLVVLIDEGSASASEIVSGAVQDWDRGVLIGRRSFGKGLVQRPFMLPDGSLIRLTTARYYTPTGRCIQRSYDSGIDDYSKELTKRYEHGEYYHADSIHFPDSLKYSTMKNGRTVYGGGGIMPDIFIPVDTTYSSKLYTNILRKGVLNRYVMDYVLENRDVIKNKYYLFDAYNNSFVVDDSMIDDLRAMAEKDGVTWDEEQYLRSEDLLKMQIKALIARNIWDIEKYYQVILREDDAVNKALEVLGSKKLYNEILSGK